MQTVSQFLDSKSTVYNSNKEMIAKHPRIENMNKGAQGTCSNVSIGRASLLAAWLLKVAIDGAMVSVPARVWVRVWCVWGFVYREIAEMQMLAVVCTTTAEIIAFLSKVTRFGWATQ